LASQRLWRWFEGKLSQATQVLFWHSGRLGSAQQSPSAALAFSPAHSTQRPVATSHWLRLAPRLAQCALVVHG
jgi:hypothetical protein